MSSSRFGPNFRLLFLAALLGELSFALLVHFPGFLSELGVTEAVIGILYAGAAVVSLLFRPTLGRILDLSHRRTVLLVTGASNALIVLTFVTVSVWGPYLWVLFLIQRGLQVALFTTMLTYAADSLPVERRTQGLAIFGLSGLIPIAIGGLVGDLVINSFGFSGLFVVSAAAGLSSWTMVWRLPVLPVRGRQPRRSFWAALGQGDLMPLWLATLCFTVGLETLFTFTRTYVDERGLGTTGVFFGVYGVAAAATRIFGGSRYDRISLRPLAVVSIAVYGCALAVLGVAQSITWFVVAAFIAGAGHGSVFPVLSSQVVARSRTAERGSAMSIFTSIFDVALLVAAPAVGLLIEGSGYDTAFSVVGLALVVGALIYGVWDGRVALRTEAAASAAP